MSELLRYGYGIQIGAGETEGRVTARGFADPNVYYQTFSESKYFKNYRNAIFQILPVCTFELNDELKLSKGTPQQMAKLQERAESQKKQFLLTIESKKDSPVCFGHKVVFRHVDSQAFLAGTINPSKGSNGAFALELSQTFSQKLIFLLLPSTSFEFEGNPIPFDSNLQIKNQFNNGYVTFQSFGRQIQGSNQTSFLQKRCIQTNQNFQIPIKKKSLNSKLFQVVTHFIDLSDQQKIKQNPTSWKIHLHAKELQNDILISHDLVYFRYTGRKNEIVLKKMKLQSKELNLYDCLWEIEQVQSDKKNSYILRHLMSGNIFGTVIDVETKRVFPSLIDISDSSKPFQYVQLEPAIKDYAQVNSGSFVHIMKNNMVLEIESIICDLNLIFIEYKNYTLSLNRPVPFTTSTLSYKEKGNQKDCFVIEQIEDELKKQLLFALSFHSVIIELQSNLKWGAIQAMKRISYESMIKITEKITEIKTFLKKPTEDKWNTDLIDHRKQNICKDLGMSQLILELLFLMNINAQEEIFAQQHHERQKFNELYFLLYQVLFDMIQGNEEFKSHILQWILQVRNDFFKGITVANQILKELTKDHLIFLKYYVQHKFIGNITQTFLALNNDEQQIRFLRLFQQSCLYKNEVIRKNQRVITNIFYQQFISSEKYLSIQFVLKQKSNNTIFQKYSQFLYLVCCLIKFRNQDTCNIISDDFPLKTLSKIFLRSKINYFQMQKKDSDANNNQQLQNNYSQKPLIEEKKKKTIFDQKQSSIQFNQYYFERINALTLKIIHYLHATGLQFYPIPLQRQCFLLQECKNPEIISLPEQQKKKILPFIQILQNLPTKLDQTTHYQNKAIILNFWKQTIQLGFWNSKESLRSFVKCLENTMLLQEEQNKTETMTDQKLSAKIHLNLVQCKQICLNAIDSLLQLEYDLFKQEFIKMFVIFYNQKPNLSYNKKNGFTEFICFFQKYKINQNNTEVNNIFPFFTKDFVDKLSTLIEKKESKLTVKIIDILRKIFQFQLINIKLLQKITIINDQKSLQIYNEIKSNRYLFYLCQTSNINKSQRQNIIGILSKIIIYMKRKSVMSSSNQQFAQKINFTLSQVIQHHQKISFIKKYQKIIRSLRIHSSIIKLIQTFTIQKQGLEQRKKEKINEENQQQTLQRLLLVSFRFLRCLSQNFQAMKIQLRTNINLFRTYLSQDCGALQLIQCLYSENQILLHDKTKISQLINDVCAVIESCTQITYKYKLLELMRALLYYKGTVLVTNQIAIMKALHDTKYSQIIPKTQEQKFSVEGSNIIVENKFNYYISWLSLMSCLVDNQNSTNLGKLIKIFFFNQLVTEMQCKSFFVIFQRTIRRLINRLYYFTDYLELHLVSVIVERDLLMISRQLKHCFEERMEKQKMVINGSRFKYLCSYNYSLMMECLGTLNQIFSNIHIQQVLLQKIEKQENAFSVIIAIWSTLQALRSYFRAFKDKDISTEIKFLLHNIRAFKKKSTLMSDMFDNQNLKMSKMNASDFYNIQEEESQQDVNKSLSPLSQLNVLKNDKTWSTVKYFANQTRSKGIVHAFENVITNLITCPLTPAMSYFLQNPNTHSSSYFSKINPLHNQTFIRQIVDINDKHPHLFNNKSIIFVLKMITKLITSLNSNLSQENKRDENENENENEDEEQIEDDNDNEIQYENENENNKQQKYTKEIKHTSKQQIEKAVDQWGPQDWENNSIISKQIEQMQNALIGQNVGQLLVNLMQKNSTQNIEFINQVLICGIAVLLGGNPKSQKDIIDRIKADSQNVFFANINLLIDQLGKQIKKYLAQMIQTEAVSNKQDQYCRKYIINMIRSKRQYFDDYNYYNDDNMTLLRIKSYKKNIFKKKIHYENCIITYRRIFKFLQLLCQNNNIDGKNLMRCQQRHPRFNFIQKTTEQLSTIFSMYKEQIASATDFMLDFILEVTQIPMSLNQEVFFNSPFLESIQALRIIQNGENSIVSKEAIKGVYFKTIKIILSNLQGNQDQFYRILDDKIQGQFLFYLLDIKLAKLQITTKNDFIKVTNNLNNVESFDEDIAQLLEVMIVFMKVKLRKEKSKIKTIYEQKKGELHIFLQQQFLSIQVADSQHSIQTIFFPKLPVFKSLSSAFRDQIMGQVSRNSKRQKIVSLLGYSKPLNQKIKDTFRLKIKQNIREKDMISNYKWASILSIIICLYICVTSEVTVDNGEVQFNFSPLFQLIRILLSVVQFAFLLAHTYCWYKLGVWQQIDTQYWEEDQSQEDIATIKADTFLNKLSKFWHSQEMKLTQSLQFWRLLLLLVTSFIGIWYYPPLFFIHLIDFFAQIQQLGSILASVVYSARGLLMVASMGIVFAYVFCSVTFSNYVRDIYQNEFSDACETMPQCVMSLFISGAIGESMKVFQVQRFIYDSIYTTFFGMLFENIIAGLMIDAFTSLREQSAREKQDKKNVCYVCGMEKEVIEQKNESFDGHTRGRHFLWNYLFYIYLLEHKNATDYTGIEYEIKGKYAKPEPQMDVSWFPFRIDSEFDLAEQSITLTQHLQQKTNALNAFSKSPLFKSLPTLS